MTSLQISNKQLDALKKAKEIDRADIIRAQSLFGISKSTIYLYTSGKGLSPNTAYDLAHFFTKCRDERITNKRKVKTK